MGYRISSFVAVRERFRDTIERWNLLSEGDGVLAAVSGGIDSVVLLHLVKEFSRIKRLKVSVAHFNHRLRGKDSDRDEAFVKNLCRVWKIKCVTGRAPVWASRENLEARAREKRYAFLMKTARKLGLAKIVTAHHADDQAETFLIRWLQGAGLRGLSGMPLRRSLSAGRRRFEVVRPLLMTSRREIEDYARLYRLEFREDPSNAADDFLRSRVRRLLRPLRHENPKLPERTALNAVFLQADDRYLTDVVQEYFCREVKRGRGRVAVSLSQYSELPPSMRYRLIQRMAQELMGATYALPAEAVLKMDRLLEDPGPRKHYDLPSLLGFQKEKGRFEIFRAKPRPCKRR